MESKKFMIGKINQLVDKHPAISIRYQFDGDHIVEVLPRNMLTESEEFQDDINDIFIEFDEKYTEDLMFVTEGDYIRVKNVTYEKKGLHFQNNAIVLILEKENLKVKVEFNKSYKSYKLYENEYSKVESKHTGEMKETAEGEYNYAIAA